MYVQIIQLPAQLLDLSFTPASSSGAYVVLLCVGGLLRRPFQTFFLHNTHKATHTHIHTHKHTYTVSFGFWHACSGCLLEVFQDTFLYARTHTHIHTHTHTHTQTHTHTRTQTHKHTHKHIHTQTHIHTDSFGFWHACSGCLLEVFQDTFLYARIHTNTHTHTHTQIHRLLWLLARMWWLSVGVPQKWRH